MSSNEEVVGERRRKRDMLVEAGMNPYTAKSGQTHALKAVAEGFDALVAGAQSVTVVGRVMALRVHGGSAFADLFDGTAKFQLFFSKDAVGEELFELFVNAIDLGDFIEATGVPFVTKRETKAIGVSVWHVLTKALQAIPSEHFGIKDEEERYRKRYLDILLDPELQELFKKKSAFWSASRRFLEEKGFAEVHTPTLESTTGGAEANPFVTHHDDFDMSIFLRISVGELWQKRLMAAGIPRTFEVGRVYRNEGTSPDHLQEFTNIELYAAYMNFDDGLSMLEEHVQYVLDHAFEGKRQFFIKGFDVDFSGPFKRIDYVDTVKEMTGVDVVAASYDELLATVTKLGIAYEGNNRERLTDTLWKFCRKKIVGPVWLTGHPKLVSPLSKEAEEKKGTVLRGQLIIAGAEFNNCFAELNDADEQRHRFELQAELLKKGDTEAMMPDFEFVEMLEFGMPPTFGAATLGERFFAYLVDKPIRETQYFPLMRPKAESGL
jgi:lysyl-tRNA synthetase class 2